jgi:hypothetical protein
MRSTHADTLEAQKIQMMLHMLELKDHPSWCKCQIDVCLRHADGTYARIGITLHMLDIKGTHHDENAGTMCACATHTERMHQETRKRKQICFCIELLNDYILPVRPLASAMHPKHAK